MGDAMVVCCPGVGVTLIFFLFCRVLARFVVLMLEGYCSSLYGE